MLSRKQVRIIEAWFITSVVLSGKKHSRKQIARLWVCVCVYMRMLEKYIVKSPLIPLRESWCIANHMQTQTKIDKKKNNRKQTLDFYWTNSYTAVSLTMHDLISTLCFLKSRVSRLVVAWDVNKLLLRNTKAINCETSGCAACDPSCLSHCRLEINAIL